MSAKLNIVSSAVWIKRGVAKAKPEKVKLDHEELRQLIDNGEVHETSDDEHMESETEQNPVAPSRGLRGSLSNLAASTDNQEDKYKMDCYDNEEVADRDGLRGIACFANNKDDPYMTNVVDSDDESDAGDLELKETDNLVAALKCEDDESALVCYLYNHDDKDWYVHHHYDLPSPALHVESVRYDPGSDDRRGNLAAVGSLDGDITIWDLDILDLPEPCYTLGTPKSESAGKKKKKAKNWSGQTAVLSLAWNEQMPHVLASGGADSQLLLWDLEKCVLSTSVGCCKEMLQSIAWHPTEKSVLLAGSMSGTLSVVDCVTMNGEIRASWDFGKKAEVNKVKWDTFNNTCAYVACEDGYIRYVDSRVTGKEVYSVKAYDDKAVESMALNCMVKDLFVTVGEHNLSIWKNDPTGCTLAHSEDLDLGTLHTVEFCPDIPNVLVVGGELNGLIKPIDISLFSGVQKVFQ
uniref:WD_REPEATS_REGION domain-containing protein n=1 Tax=Steinernema glaseri TaxID=37863 RepID=A0A1I8ATQ5_9BILA